MLACCFFYYVHRIKRECGMLLLLLLHHKLAIAFPEPQHEFLRTNELVNSFEAYHGDRKNQSQDGSDYEDDEYDDEYAYYNDYDYDDDYEYEDKLQSVGVDSEVKQEHLRCGCSTAELM